MYDDKFFKNASNRSMILTTLNLIVYKHNIKNDISSFIQTLLREREIGIPPEQSLETAKAIKERCVLFLVIDEEHSI